MSLPRRWFTVLVLAVISILLLYHSQSASRSPFIPSPPRTGYSTSTFKWKDRPQHFPLTSFVPIPTGRPSSIPAIQHIQIAESASEKDARLQRRQLVKDAFAKGWSSYKQKAWMHDEMRPVSGEPLDTFGGWAATLVDALDTMWIMDMQSDFRKAVDAAVNINFSFSTHNIVNMFETNIRYLGGFLSAYDLSGDKRLLEKAIEVGEMLLVPFDTPNHLPISRWDWEAALKAESQEAPSGMLVSELGSFTVEFTRLSQITGDPRWYDAINRITNLFHAQQEETYLPGLFPIFISPKEANLTYNSAFSLGGMADSLFEYFPKQFALLGGVGPGPIYRRLYERSAMAAEENLFFRPMTPENHDILISGDAHAYRPRAETHVDLGKGAEESAIHHRPRVTHSPKGQHLTCFLGGHLAIGSRLFSMPHHLELARQITDGCIWAYAAMPRGIMPEVAMYLPCPLSSLDASRTTPCAWNETYWHETILSQAYPSDQELDVHAIIAKRHLQPGITSLSDPRYLLRPEAIESVFILYRVTGDKLYQDKAWDMFTSIMAATQTDLANSAVADISLPKGQNLVLTDQMESFWFAETLKYFYLIFSDFDLITLDEWVLNTEAHPFKRNL